MEQPIIANDGLQIAVQYVYLDFDGELTSYNGEILTVDNVEVKESSLTEERINFIVAELNAKYSDQNVIFVTDKPKTAEYSTIFIGKTSAFDPYGNFAGLAETIDSGNKNKTDKAFVMLDSTASNEAIISTIAHETDHLLGTLNHGGEDLKAYATLFIHPGDNYTIANNTVFRGESIVSDHGAIVNDGNISIGNNVVFTEYVADFPGGAIQNWGGYDYEIGWGPSPLNIGNNAVFSNNIAVDGGAIYTVKGDFIIGANAVFSDNMAYQSGGAICNKGTNMTLGDNAVFSSNMVIGYGGYGGAIYHRPWGSSEINIASATLTIGNNAVFSGNMIIANSPSDVSVYGGAIVNYIPSENVGTANIDIGNGAVFSSNMVIANDGNWVNVFGGAICNRENSYFDATTIVTIGDNAVFYDNMAIANGGTDVFAYGGAIYNKGIMTIGDNAVFSSNVADLGGAIYNCGFWATIDWDPVEEYRGQIALGDAKFATQTDTIYNTGDIILNGNVSFAGNVTLAKETDYDGYTLIGTLQNNGNIDFNISVRAEEDGILLNDWELVSGNGTYSITVSPEQADGEYKLIGNVTEFDFAITVKDDSGKFSQEISLEDPVVTIGDAEFRLKLDKEEKVLSLVVDNDLSDQVLERLARNSNVNGRYVFPDTIYNVPQIRSKKRGDIIEVNVNNKTYYFKFDALFDDNNYSGFFAMGLLQCDKDGKELGNAILVCQGTQGDTIGTDQANEGIADIFADLNPNGIGYGQSQSQAFAAAVAWINRYQNDGDKTYITGQSLGGAVAQMAASKAGDIYKLVTFNPPGIATSFADVSADQVVHYVDSGDMVSMGGRKFVESINGDTTVNIVQTGFILGNASNQGSYQIAESNFEWLLALHDWTFLSTGNSSMDYTPNSVDRTVIYSTDSTDFLEANNFSYLHLPYNGGSISQNYQGQIITGKDGSKFFFNSDYARYALRLALGNVTIANNLLTRERSDSGRALTGNLLEIAKAAKPAIIYYAVTHPGTTLSIAAVALTLKVAFDNFGDELYDFFINRGIYKKAYDSTNITIGDKSLVNSHDKSGKDYRTVDLDSDNVPDLIYNITDRRFEALEYVDPLLSFGPVGNSGFALKATIDKAFGWVAIKMPLLSYAAYKVTSALTGNTSLDGNIVKKGLSFYLLDDPATEYVINLERDWSVTAEQGVISFTEDEITADTTALTVYASDIDMSKTVGGSNDTLALTISVGDREKSVVLQETAVEGIFSGTIKINQKDGISVLTGEKLKASYTDSNDGNQQQIVITQEIAAVSNNISLEFSQLIADDYTGEYDSTAWSSFHILLNDENISDGKYLVAKNIGDFSNDVVLYDDSEYATVTLNSTNSSSISGNLIYSIEFQNNNLYLKVVSLISSIKADYSQVVWQSDSEYFTAELSCNNFDSSLKIKTDGQKISTFGIAAGDYVWGIKLSNSQSNLVSNKFSVGKNNTSQKFVSDKDGNMDLFFVQAGGKWEDGYFAKHSGVKDGWGGTGEKVQLAGKNVLADVFAGSSDANLLVLTDDSNGDALFVEDIYTSFGKDSARIAKIDEIRAGAGDDVVDLTSQKFAYSGDGVKIYGGLGNDTIWANNGNNTLFGDAGNDRIVGGANNDVIAGGIGNDSMHGGGGSDIFCFGNNWGVDAVEQLAGGEITLWFESGSENNWNASTLTYTDGTNSVKVSGISADNISLKFGDDSSDLFNELSASGCFDDAASEKIFEDKNKGFLA